MQQPLLTVETSHNRGKYVRGESYKSPSICIFEERCLLKEKKGAVRWTKIQKKI